MRIIKLAAALCLAATIAACASQQSPGHPFVTGATRTAGQSQTTTAAAEPAKFGATQSWDGGLSITISAPRSLTPSDTAFPPSPREAVFEVTIDNRSTEIYKPALLLVKATAAGQATEEIGDPAQGLNGIVSGAQDVPPDKTLRLTVAFAVPAQPVTLELTVQPDSGMRYNARRYTGEV